MLFPKENLYEVPISLLSNLGSPTLDNSLCLCVNGDQSYGKQMHNGFCSSCIVLRLKITFPPLISEYFAFFN